MSLTAAEILGSKDRLLSKKVSTPEWSETRDVAAHVWVRELRGDELDLLHELLTSRDNNTLSEKETIAGICVLCVCDDAQMPLFTKDDIPDLLLGPLAPMRRCSETAMLVAGFSDAAKEELVGNSESGQTA